MLCHADWVMQKGAVGEDGVETAATHERAQDAVRQLLASNHDGEENERALIKSVLYVFVELDIEVGVDVDDKYC